MSYVPMAGTANGTIALGSLLGGRYRLRARVGAGGMATIYAARDESLERDVAVKVLHPHLADDAELLARFRTEARHAAGLLHPNIVNVFDQGLADLPYIVMEFVDGPSLREVLIRRRRLTPAEAAAIIEPVCDALDRAHASGLVHRDVKPENILIAPDGTPKVADFGIARAVAATSHTQTGTLIGSVHYMAPELVDGREATPASDQYAVGVLLFELVTGRKPLPADSPMAVALRHARENIPAPSRVVDDCPRSLDRVVATATSAQPRRRYPDLAALAADLRAAVPGGPTPLVLPSPGDGAGGTLVIPPETADTVAVRDPAVARRRADPTTRISRSRGPWLRRLGLPLLVGLLLLGLTAGGSYAAWNYVLAPYRDVPDVSGLPVREAAVVLRRSGFGLEEQPAVNHLVVAEGAVVSQDPAPANRLRRGGEVAVVPSAGPATVQMPAVAGLAEAEARERLAADEFAVVRHESFSDTVPAGHVVAQLPEPGAAVEQGDEVIINVSRGIEQVTVPDLSGTGRDEAAALLAAASLQVAFAEEYSDEQPDVGRVLRQSAAPGSAIDKNSTVTVTVSGGPVTFEAPDVRGLSVEEATQRLAAEDLRARVIEEPRPRVGPFRRGEYGVVEEQVPEDGDEVRRGDAVTLYVFTATADEREGND
jgi:beta-lactam-binding protein with PASTA domain